MRSDGGHGAVSLGRAARRATTTTTTREPDEIAWERGCGFSLNRRILSPPGGIPIPFELFIPIPIPHSCQGGRSTRSSSGSRITMEKVQVGVVNFATSMFDLDHVHNRDVRRHLLMMNSMLRRHRHHPRHRLSRHHPSRHRHFHHLFSRGHSLLFRRHHHRHFHHLLRHHHRHYHHLLRRNHLPWRRCVR